MTDRNNKHNSNQQTSTSYLDCYDCGSQFPSESCLDLYCEKCVDGRIAAEKLTKRTIHDRNSDQTIGSPKVHVPHKGNEWANSLRTPETFLGPIADGSWDGRGIPRGGTSYRPASASGVGSGSGPAQSGLDVQGRFRTPIRLKGLSAGQMLMKAIDKESGGMSFREACVAAEKSGTHMIYQLHKTWHHRGIRTEFSKDERAVNNWAFVGFSHAASEAILAQAAPKYSLKTQLWIGAWIFLSIASGVALGFMKGCR